MAERRRVEARNPWAGPGGYSRAVRVGDTIWVAGTTSATEDGVVLDPDDAYAQARESLDKVEAALTELGARLADVVQTRMFVTDISRHEDVLRAHGESFRGVRPVTTMVEVSALIDPRLLVEIEAVAVVSDG